MIPAGVASSSTAARQLDPGGVKAVVDVDVRRVIARRTSGALNPGRTLPQQETRMLLPEQLAAPTRRAHRSKATQEPPPLDASLPSRGCRGNRSCASALPSVLRRGRRRAARSGIRGTAQRGRSGQPGQPQGGPEIQGSTTIGEFIPIE